MEIWLDRRPFRDCAGAPPAVRMTGVRADGLGRSGSAAVSSSSSPADKALSEAGGDIASSVCSALGLKLGSELSGNWAVLISG
jgi:hypothetical protein